MHRKFQMNVRKSLCSDRALEQNARRSYGTPSLEMLKNCLDAILRHVLWHGPAGAGSLDQMPHGAPFQPDAPCDSERGVGEVWQRECREQGRRARCQSGIPRSESCGEQLARHP
ncbi:unnamed protein product [Coccothraustes coccothraustes]